MKGINNTQTTTIVSSMKNGNDILEYTYDELGNITSISKNGTLIESYTYDSSGLRVSKIVKMGLRTNTIWLT